VRERNQFRKIEKEREKEREKNKERKKYRGKERKNKRRYLCCHVVLIRSSGIFCGLLSCYNIIRIRVRIEKFVGAEMWQSSHWQEGVATEH
jgi:hypothetical protein